jgi:hypothetical protein
LTGLTYLDVRENPLTHFTLPGSLNHLASLGISKTELTQLTLPLGLTNLTTLFLAENHLTNLVLPPDLYRLETLNVGGNQLTSLNLPSGLTNLTGLFFVGNQLTNVTLPPDMTQLTEIGFLSNPLTTFVLSELTATNLAGDVAALRDQGVSIFTYPSGSPTGPATTVCGKIPIGNHRATWSVRRSWIDRSRGLEPGGPCDQPARQHQLQRRDSKLLSAEVLPRVIARPAGEHGVHPAQYFHDGQPDQRTRTATTDEGPQTTVTLTRGFWIGQYEVTQGEYLSVMSTNPSPFPGDLSRPVTSVSWPDATNYCAKLTQQELAAGRIPAGSQYRLPTEASGNAPRAPARRRGSATETIRPTPAWGVTLGTPRTAVSRRTRSGRSFLIHGDCTTWKETSWNGARIGSASCLAAFRPIRQALLPVRADGKSLAVALSTTPTVLPVGRAVLV